MGINLDESELKGNIPGFAGLCRCGPNPAGFFHLLEIQCLVIAAPAKTSRQFTFGNLIYTSTLRMALAGELPLRQLLDNP